MNDSEIYFVQANTARCFLCNPTPERFMAHVRDGSWTFCSAHMQVLGHLGDEMERAQPIRALPRTPGG